MMTASLAGAAAAAAAEIAIRNRSAPARAPLDSEAVAIRADGSRWPIRPGSKDLLLPGTRVLDETLPGSSPTAAERAGRQLTWLGEGTVPGVGTPWMDMTRDALLDLNTLLLDGGGVVAAWSAPWRYVWPRDAAFVAAALARTGHGNDAEGVVTALQRVQQADGHFQARYLPDLSGVPDGRGVQLDGSGWALWGLHRVAAELPDARRATLIGRHRALLDRSTQAALAAVAGQQALPPPSPDYWEAHERSVTLGTAAPLLLGLRSATELYRWLGLRSTATAAQDGANRLDEAIRQRFGREGYPRHLGGSDPDAAITFLMPPLGTATSHDVIEAWQRAVPRMRRVAGGLAPGSGWRQDGVSWTPETALFALAAAGIGDAVTAAQWLTWLSAHRTRLGALPERVLFDGSPAGPAPLAWTAALVILTVAGVERQAPVRRSVQ